VSVDAVAGGLSHDLHMMAGLLVLQLFLLQKLNFHLTIHSPFRPLTGFIIDIKVRKESDIFPSPSSGSNVWFPTDKNSKLPQPRAAKEGGRQVPGAQSP